jgi:hypothetical protein
VAPCNLLARRHLAQVRLHAAPIAHGGLVQDDARTRDLTVQPAARQVERIRRQMGSATRRAFAGGRVGVKGKIAIVPSGPLKKPPNGASTHENGSHP